jgi:hypothetical protein
LSRNLILWNAKNFIILRLLSVLQLDRNGREMCHFLENGKPAAYWNLVKYFVHGAIFSLLQFALTWVWVFAFVARFSIGWIEFVIEVGLLFLVIGFLNTLVTDVLWFAVKTGFWSLLGHGFVLYGVLSILDGLIVFIPSHLFPRIATTVVTRVIVSFPYGFVGKGVAGLWEETPPQGRASQRLS